MTIEQGAHAALAVVALLLSALCLRESVRDAEALADGNGRWAIAREAIARNLIRVAVGVVFVVDALLHGAAQAETVVASIREGLLIVLAVALALTAGIELRERWSR